MAVRSKSEIAPTARPAPVAAADAGWAIQLGAFAQAQKAKAIAADAVGDSHFGGRSPGGPSGPGTTLHGNGASHAPTVFRRKTG